MRENAVFFGSRKDGRNNRKKGMINIGATDNKISLRKKDAMRTIVQNRTMWFLISGMENAINDKVIIVIDM